MLPFSLGQFSLSAFRGVLCCLLAFCTLVSSVVRCFWLLTHDAVKCRVTDSQQDNSSSQSPHAPVNYLIDAPRGREEGQTVVSHLRLLGHLDLKAFCCFMFLQTHGRIPYLSVWLFKIVLILDDQHLAKFNTKFNVGTRWQYTMDVDYRSKV